MEKKELLKLTNPQKSLWSIEQFHPNTNVNKICGILTVETKLDFIAFKKAINIFIQNNDSMRTKLNINESQVFQYICDHTDLIFDEIELNSSTQKRLSSRLVT